MSDPSDETYAVSARYYDAAYAAARLPDLAFYVDLARSVGGPVLEIGCGTGRVLLPIARAGVRIHGLDRSRAMLDVLKEKLAREPQQVQSRVALHSDDLREVRLNRQFPLIIMPFRPLQHMHTIEDQLAALETVTLHLGERGQFAFDVFSPRFDSLLSGIGEERFEMEWPAEGRPGTIVRRVYRKDSVDQIHQRFSGVFIYRFYEGERIVREETAPLDMTWFTYPQLRLLFLLSGLQPVEEYGSFAKAPLDNSSPEMIFVLRKGRGDAS
ncbi:MAG TPA: class I SAM-dependent methyltransferase [Candidatus Cybelea sp.]|nr:class I SAM-dependent methyltransferase [Candidatus Cybelea sp.]